MLTLRVRIIAALGGLVLAGCGWKSDGLARLNELYPPEPADAGSADAGPIDIGMPMCIGYSGDWAVRLVQQGTIVPAGDQWNITIDDLFLAHSDGQTMALKFCDEQVAIVDANNNPVSFGQTQVPAALASALAAKPISLSLDTGTFPATPVVWLWGVQGLTNPQTDQLPTDANDPRVWDEDGDSNPGVTLSIVNPPGHRYMDRRAVWTFGPGKLTPNWITGALTSQIDQNVLGADNMLLLTNAPIMSVDNGTVYQLRCVGSTYSCPSLAKDQAALFADAPP